MTFMGQERHTLRSISDPVYPTDELTHFVNVQLTLYNDVRTHYC